MLIGVEILLAVVFLLTGVPKVIGTRYMIRAFERFGYPQSWRVLAGMVEVAASLGLLVGLFVPVIGAGAALSLCPIMIGATYTNFTKRKGGAWGATLVLLLMCGWVASVHGMEILAGAIPAI